MSATCASPIGDEALSEYALGAPDDAIDLHVLECDACAARLERALAVIDGLRTFAQVSVQPVITRAALDALRAKGARVTSVALDGDHVRWRIDDSELYVAVARADLRDIERVDVEYCTPDGSPQTVYRDAPFSRGDGEVLLCCDRHIATAHDRIRFRILGTAGGVERVLADCVVEAERDR